MIEEVSAGRRSIRLWFEPILTWRKRWFPQTDLKRQSEDRSIGDVVTAAKVWCRLIFLEPMTVSQDIERKIGAGIWERSSRKRRQKELREAWIDPGKAQRSQLVEAIHWGGLAKMPKEAEKENRLGDSEDWTGPFGVTLGWPPDLLEYRSGKS